MSDAEQESLLGRISASDYPTSEELVGASSTSTSGLSQASTFKRVLGWRQLIAAVVSIWVVVWGVVFLVVTSFIMYGVMYDVDLEPMVSGPIVIWPLTLFGELVAAAISWHFACVRTGASLAEGLALRRVSLRTMLGSMILGIAGAWFVYTTASYLEEFDSSMVDLVRLESDFGVTTHLPWTTMIAMLVAPFCEEIYYRGFLYTAFRNLAGVYVAFPVIAIWFASIHAQQLAGDWYVIAGVTVMGLVFTTLRERYNSILPSFACHLGYNWAAVGATFFY